MHILIAEDDTALATGLVHALRRSGYAVDLVENGAQADAALLGNRFDLLILDLGLPRLDGLEVLKRARAHKMRLPILILTARDSVDERVRGLDLGADDFLAKPFSLSELEARVRALDAARRGGTHADGVARRSAVRSREPHARRSAIGTLDLSARELRCSRSSSAGPAGSSTRTSSSTDCANGATRSRRTPSRSTSTGCARSSKARGS